MELLQSERRDRQDEELTRQVMLTIRRLGPADRRRMKRALAAPEPQVDELIAALRNAAVPAGQELEMRGEGLGASVSVEDGRAAVLGLGLEQAPPDGDWARSELLGAGAVAERLHVSAATLANWRTAGHAVGFLRDRRNFLYPVRQFRRGTPTPRMADVLAFFGTAEDAWEWLVTPNVFTAGEPPIDRLQADHADEVLRAAEGAVDFG